MIPNLTEFTEKLGFTAVLVPFVLAGLGVPDSIGSAMV
jgi:hypothetical protein